MQIESAHSLRGVWKIVTGSSLIIMIIIIIIMILLLLLLMITTAGILLRMVGRGCPIEKQVVILLELLLGVHSGRWRWEPYCAA